MATILRRSPLLPMILGAGACLGIGFLSAMLSGSTETNAWYQSLTLPAWQPPGWAFGAAWSILYTVIGAAAGLVWARGHGEVRRTALSLFAIQLALNFIWSPVFFGFHMVAPALGIIVLILGATVLTTFAFARVSRVAAWMLVPYMVWLGFATVLNLRVLQLN